MASKDAKPGCKVYIGNLTESTTKADLEEFISNCGTILNLWVAQRPPGFAFVIFDDPRDAEDACRDLDNRELNGNRVRVQISDGGKKQDGGRRRSRSRSRSRRRSRTPPRRRSPPRKAAPRPGPPDTSNMTTLKVGNLSFRTDPEALKRMFEKYGDIGDVYIPRDPYTKESRGFAFVRFYRKKDAETAESKLDGVKFDGRAIDVQMAKYGRPDAPGGASRRSPRAA